jgi:hypothetical protein
MSLKYTELVNTVLFILGRALLVLSDYLITQ